MKPGLTLTVRVYPDSTSPEVTCRWSLPDEPLQLELLRQKAALVLAALQTGNLAANVAEAVVANKDSAFGASLIAQMAAARAGLKYGDDTPVVPATQVFRETD